MTVTTRSGADRPASNGHPRASRLRVLAGAGAALAIAVLVVGCASSASPAQGPTTGASAAGSGSTTGVSTTPSGSASGKPDASGGGSTTVLDSLDGRTFVSTDVQGRELVPGTTISLSFSKDTGQHMLSASAGCNTMSGQAVLDGGVLRVPQLASTAMGCAQGLADQDSWLSGLLTKGADLHVHGDTVVLAADDITITLTDRAVVQPDLPFVGTEWTLDGIVRDGAVTHYADVTATLTTDGTRVSYRACNSHSGPITITGDSATAGPVISTKMACVGASADVDKAMESVLDGTFTFAVDGNRLTVTGADGTGLTFTGETSGGQTTSGAGTTGSSETTAPSGTTGPSETTAQNGTGPIVSPSISPTPTSASLLPRTTIGRHESIPPLPTRNTANETY